eukprot:3684985-Heterocapsa_arctica.AAC.1
MQQGLLSVRARPRRGEAGEGEGMIAATAVPLGLVDNGPAQCNAGGKDVRARVQLWRGPRSPRGRGPP